MIWSLTSNAHAYKQGVRHTSTIPYITSPYTLQGVSINYYNIAITRHSDGAVLGSHTTSTTEFHFNVNRVEETVEVVVAAVNYVGTGPIVLLITTNILISLFCVRCQRKTAAPTSKHALYSVG